MRLDVFPLRKPGYVASIDWDVLSPAEGQRLREFGICEGASIEALHRGGFLGRGPLACKVGRMTIAMRRTHAAAIEVLDGPEGAGRDALAQ